MLSRTAENLYWLARYVERAENMARLLDVAGRMTGLALESEFNATEWHSAIVASGCADAFFERHERATPAEVIHYLVRDPENPSSIRACLDAARRNARAVRVALTSDMWEAINTTWIEMGTFDEDALAVERIRPFLDWVKERSQLFGGAANTTMLRNDAYCFVRLGTSAERADNTARILDVKYHVLLPEHATVGGTIDYYQWAAILRSISALRAYHWIYRDRVQPWLVAELLILRPEMPRSLASCLGEITRTLEFLADAYGERGESDRLAGQIYSRLRFGRIKQVFDSGLHEFLDGFIAENAALGDEIAKQYLM